MGRYILLISKGSALFLVHKDLQGSVPLGVMQVYGAIQKNMSLADKGTGRSLALFSLCCYLPQKWGVVIQSQGDQVHGASIWSCWDSFLLMNNKCNAKDHMALYVTIQKWAADTPLVFKHLPHLVSTTR